ncbi:MAG: flagellar hook assembly protein FlgD [Spirochaetes bacterium]|nr:flagellar hook assembly protein FlgD [Spirochaetota bacterium]
MELMTRMPTEEVKTLKKEMGAFNVGNKFKKDPAEGMGRDEFLKLLTVQMSHQDPLSPMDNKEFIAQMAQFSSLEQMTHMNKSLEQMNNADTRSASFNMLGRTVDFVTERGTAMSGSVETVIMDDTSTKLNVRVNNSLLTIKPDDVLSVHK